MVSATTQFWPQSNVLVSWPLTSKRLNTVLDTLSSLLLAAAARGCSQRQYPVKSGQAYKRLVLEMRLLVWNFRFVLKNLWNRKLLQKRRR